MQTISKTAWLVSLKHNAVQALGIVMLIICAALLTTHTISLQNSCTPLLEWTNISARNCPVKLADSSGKTPDTDLKRNEKSHKPSLPIVHPVDGKSERDEKPPVKKSLVGKLPVDKPPVDKPPVDKEKELIGLAAGSVAAVGLAVIEAPVLVIAGVGFGVWLAARSLLSLSK